MSKIKRECFDKVLNKLLSFQDDIKNKEFTYNDWCKICHGVHYSIKIGSRDNLENIDSYFINFEVEFKKLNIWLKYNKKLGYFDLNVINRNEWIKISENHDRTTGRSYSDVITTDDYLSGLDIERIYETLNYLEVFED